MPTDPPADSEFATQMVEFMSTESAHEAEATAALLRRHGIAAIANATPMHADDRKRHRRDYRTFVMVLGAEVERAHAVLDEQIDPEGPATNAEIEADLMEAPEESDEELEASLQEPPPAWWQVWLKRCLLLALAAYLFEMMRHMLL